MKQVTIELNSFEDGLATNIYRGGKNQFAYGSRNIDNYTQKGVIQPTIALQRDIGDPVTFNTGAVYKASNGTFYWIGIPTSPANRIQMYTGSPGSSTSLATSGAAAVVTGPSFSKMIEFDDFLFFYDTTIDLAKFNIGTPAITLQANGAVLTSNIGSDLLTYKSFLFYCNNNKVGRATSNTAYNDSALTLETRYRVKTLTGWNNYVLVGAPTQNESGFSRVFVWDGVSALYDYSFDLPSTGLVATVNNGGIVYFFCSNNTNGNAVEPNRLLIYRWSGGTEVQLVKDFDLQATSSNSISVVPASVSAYKGKVYFTVSASSANTMGLQNGVYSIDQRGVLNLEYVDDNGASITTQDISGNFLNWIDGRLFWFWNDGTNNRKSHQSGVTYSGVARLDTLALQLDPRYESRIEEIFFRNVTFPASTSIAISIATDQAAFSAVKTLSSGSQSFIINQNDYSFQPGHVHQLRFAFTSSGSSRAQIILPIFIKANVYDNQTLTS